MTARGLAVVHRDLIITLAARHKLPTVYYYRFFVTAGGLVSYGPDPHDQYRRAAGYVDRILKGEKPADLPVQAPTKLELVINQRTARMLGLTVPPSLLVRRRGDRVVFLLHCICRLLAVRPEGANHQWRKIPPRELSIDLVADERFGRVTGRAGAS